MRRFGSAAKDAGNDAETGAEGFTVLRGALASLAANAASRAVDGLRRLGRAIVEVGRQSYESFGSREQLVGGVETLFSEAAGAVRRNALNAYKTTGQDANTYLEQVTGFSAALLQGLSGDTARAGRPPAERSCAA